MTPHLIAKAFEKTGLYPVNHSVFTPEDFTPSKASSTIAYVPETFLDAFPSSDLIEISDVAETIQDSGDEDSLDSDPTFTIEDEPDDLGSNLSHIEDDPMDVHPAHPASGLMTALMQLESGVPYRMHSVTSAALGESQMVSVKVLLLAEDQALSHEDLLAELHLAQHQLWGIYQGLGDAVSHLSATNAHCTLIHGELRSAAEWQRQREADATEQDQQVLEDGMSQIFVGQLLSYKKGNLCTLAVALALSDKGMNVELMS